MPNRPIIIDAGPALNFLSTGNEHTLLAVVGRGLYAPETVEHEVLRKSARDRRFIAVEKRWKILKGNYITVLSDEVTPQLERVAESVIAVPLAVRKKQAAGLCETMVVIHAVARALKGSDAVVIIDDGGGRKLAIAQRIRLEHLRAQGKPVGSITLLGTVTVLELAVVRGVIEDHAEARRIYERLRARDDGLGPISATRLLDPSLWEKAAQRTDTPPPGA